MKKQTENPKCRQCSKCCQYLCIEIDKPDERIDFDDIAWLLAHKKISIRVEGREWYLMINNLCGFLDRHGRCKIYEIRPSICRRYKPGPCDFDTRPGEKDLDADHIFVTLKELFEYRDSHFPKKGKKKRKSKIRRKS